MKAFSFYCPKCGKSYDFGTQVWKCECGSHLKCSVGAGFKKSQIKYDRFNMWRYDEAYPIKYEAITASFNEGMTPLFKTEWGRGSFKVKLECLMPTGSFKDRGAVMTINYIKNCGISDITEDSSGNAAASMGAYSALAGIKARIFIPAMNSSGKIMQTAAFGAEIVPVCGSREEVAFAAQKYESSYVGHNWHPMFCQGVKSIAFEIWEQCGFSVPDAIIAPCGGGSLVLGIAYGFEELLLSGEISSLPRIYAAQPENCNPVVRAFEDNTSEFVPKPTIAEGTSIANPIKLDEIVETIRNTGGTALSIKEGEIIDALKKSCQKGIYIEPTSALVFAAYDILVEQKEISINENVVVIATGNGLKAGSTINELLFC